MTSTVIHMTHSVDRDLVKRLFKKFGLRYGSLWTARLGERGDWNACEGEWFSELVKFDIDCVRAAVNLALSQYLSFPPTLGQLVHLCMQHSGVPDQSEVIRAMVARDFNHPLVKALYDKVGSWELKHGTRESIDRIVREHYPQCLAAFQAQPQQAWAALADYTQSKAQSLPPPERKQEHKPHKPLAQRLEELRAEIEERKKTNDFPETRVFDEKKLNPLSKSFDRFEFDEYRRYLLSVSDSDILGLPPSYVYDRAKFLSLREQPELLRRAGYRQASEEEEVASKRKYEPSRPYKQWNQDV